MELVYNAIRTPDGTVIESTHRHHFVRHDDENGEIYFVDGGYDYGRRSINKEEYEELAVPYVAPHHIRRKHFRWGTYGKCGTQTLVRVPLKDLSDHHIQAILNTQLHMSVEMQELFEIELKYRKRRNIHVADVDRYEVSDD